MKSPDEVEKEALAIGEMLSVIDDIRDDIGYAKNALNNRIDEQGRLATPDEIVDLVRLGRWRCLLQGVRDSVTDLALEVYNLHEEP